MNSLTYRIRVNRRLRALRPQASPAGLTWVQAATIVVGCMVAGFVLWGSMVLLLAMARYA